MLSSTFVFHCSSNSPNMIIHVSDDAKKSESIADSPAF